MRLKDDFCFNGTASSSRWASVFSKAGSHSTSWPSLLDWASCGLTPDFLTLFPIFLPITACHFGVLACPSLHTHTRVELCWQSIFLTALAMSLLPVVWPIVL